MGSMEQKNNGEWSRAIEEKLAGRYARRSFGGDPCFVNNNGVPFRLFVFPDSEDPALAIEYAEDGEAASKGLFEDGDRFYLSDCASPDDMFQNMVKEIDG